MIPERRKTSGHDRVVLEGVRTQRNRNQFFAHDRLHVEPA